MAETPEEPNQQEADAADSSDDVISLDDLDSLLEEADPEFVQDMNQMSQDDSLQNEDLDLSDGNVAESVDEASAADETKKKKREPPAFVKKLAVVKKVFAPFIYIKNKVVKINRNFARWIAGSAISVWHFIRFDLPKLAVRCSKFVLKQLKAALAFIKKQWKWFKDLKWNQKLALFVGTGTLAGLVFLVLLNLGQGWVPALFRPLVGSLTTVANQVYEISAESKKVNFSRAFPQPEFPVLLQRIVVNLKRPYEEANPLGIFEFYLVADAQETAVEVKDREKQIVDKVQRVLEEHSYQDVITSAGKAKIRNEVRDEINLMLNLGRIEKVFLKTAVAKP